MGSTRSNTCAHIYTHIHNILVGIFCFAFEFHSFPKFKINFWKENKQICVSINHHSRSYYLHDLIQLTGDSPDSDTTSFSWFIWNLIHPVYLKWSIWFIRLTAHHSTHDSSDSSEAQIRLIPKIWINWFEPRNGSWFPLIWFIWDTWFTRFI